MQNKMKDAFTLIELLVVIMIIGMLSAIVLGSSKIARAKGSDARAKADLQELANELDEYRLEYSSYPGSIQTSFADLKLADFGSNISEVMTGKLEGLKCYDATALKFMDPWDTAYQYRKNGRFSYELFSAGPDGVSENDDDIAVTDV